jgi:DNA end-binding protein Ku
MYPTSREEIPVPSTVWKGHLTFGLVSIPVKLYRAARPEKVSFRQLHQATGARVRQTLVAEAPPEPEWEPEPDPETAPPQAQQRSRVSRAPEPIPFVAARPAAPVKPAIPPPPPEQRELSRSEIVKGYEYARDRYVTLTKEELAAITPRTAREMQILEFVQLSEVDPIYFETSYYVAPDKGGERAYSLLFESLRQSGFVGVAQIAMHNREHVVIVRPARTGIVLHTMFYETEIRRNDEYRTDTSGVVAKELDLALLLIRNLAATFEAGKYRDTYREKLDALIQSKISGEETVEAPAPKPAGVVNILEALQRSLEAASDRKPPAKEESRPERAKLHRRRSGDK